MARDYKHAGANRGKGAGLSGWAGVGLGFTAGLVLAVLVHLYHSGGLLPVEPPAAEDVAKEGRDTGVTEEKPAPRRPIFDFYRLLPNYELVIPEEDIAVEPVPELAPLEAAGVYVLQAGSFRNAADADRLRARLALLGIQSRVQTVTIDDTDSWHRVRIGPSGDLDELNGIRRRLVETGIEALVIRVAD